MARNRPRGSPQRSAHSVRVEDQIWIKARTRAQEDGSTMNEVMELFVTGYATGVLARPKLQVVYSQVAGDQAPALGQT